MSAAEAKKPYLVSEPEKPIPPVGNVPGLGFSMQVDLGAGRVCTLQTFLPNDCSIDELNAMLDKMTKAGDRQRAHYNIEGLLRDLKKFEKEQEQALEDLAKSEAEHKETQAGRTASVEKAYKALGTYEAAATVDAAERGRRVPGPTAQDRANMKRTQNGIEKLKVEIEVAENEHQKSIFEAQKVINRRQEMIDKTKEEIARCKEIVGKGLEG